ncbi:MAG: sigma 54-interacting transcriptional regulator [Phycisphaerae bacterium]
MPRRKTESRQAQPALDADPAALCCSIMESVADGILAIDLDHNITAFNPAASAITGMPREQAIGRKFFDVLHPDVPEEDCPVCRVIATGDTIAGRRITIINAAGDEVALNVSAAPLRDKSGKIVGGVQALRDVSAVERLRRELTESYTYQDIVGKNARMRQLFKILPAIAESESTVLIEGESGTGKELFARAVHDLSPRESGPYIVVNCGALPETLLESELFGYKKGAFTDAKRDKPGKFELAQRGSIFLDEIESVTRAVQVKLLRVIQEREFEPLGGTRPVKADVRIIAASNQPLRDLVAQGRFRDDLFYRLNVVTLELPPLRERRDDIPLLVERFVSQFNAAKGKEIAGVSPAALRVLTEYDFPGNVRELQNVIERAFVLCEGGLIDLQHLARSVIGDSPGMNVDHTETDRGDKASPKPLALAEADVIRAALAHHNGHRARTASELGISLTTLWRKIKRYGISV